MAVPRWWRPARGPCGRVFLPLTLMCLDLCAPPRPHRCRLIAVTKSFCAPPGTPESRLVTDPGMEIAVSVRLLSIRTPPHTDRPAPHVEAHVVGRAAVGATGVDAGALSARPPAASATP